MLSFARGNVKDTSGANIKQAIDNTRAILKEGLERRGVEVTVEVESELPALPASQADLEQLFLNLLTNSRDAMPQGGRLLIAALRTESGLQMRVEDTGCGIPTENLAKVMEPFFSTKPHGNGLGLSICRSLCDLLGYRLEVQSEPGRGSTFSIVLLRTQADLSLWERVG